MFGFLKDKLKNALGKFTKDVEKETTVEKKEIVVEEKPAKKKEVKQVIIEQRKETVKKETKAREEPKKDQKKSTIQSQAKGSTQKEEPRQSHPALKEHKAKQQAKTEATKKKEETKPEHKSSHKETHNIAENKEIHTKESVEEKKIEDAPEPKKRSFFDKIFGRKEKEEIIEQKQELLQELEKGASRTFAGSKDNIRKAHRETLKRAHSGYRDQRRENNTKDCA